MKPRLSFYNRQRRQRSSLKLWRKIAERALPDCLAAAKSDQSPLKQLEEVEITFVTDRVIARVHADFLADPTPTDVITFHHGEILISLDTAARQSAEYGQPYEHEAALYIIHGLLHLGDWDDHDPAEAAEMKTLQERILMTALTK
ncbi:hypothetical protein BH11VER1_BH11VER1_35220 [soil metagenome]